MVLRRLLLAARPGTIAYHQLTLRKLLYTTHPGVHWRGMSGQSGTKDGVRVRFAPSPTGQLHLGGLRTALYNYLFARAHNGTFILRVEDTDQDRLVEGAWEKQIEMLKWATIDIDEGPGFGGNYGPYIQSQRLDLYHEMAEVLLKKGAAYHCFCTPRRLDILRKQAMRLGEVPKYDNRCRHLSRSEVEEKLAQDTPYTLRFKLTHINDAWPDLVYGPIVTNVASIEGDPIIMKSDGFPTYHFANVVDDHFMEITHVLRGLEWQVSTTKHILLYKAFGWKPPLFAHLPLLLNKDGKKLSKRQGDIQVEHYKNQGYFPETILSLITYVGSGFKVKYTGGMNIQDLVKNFNLSLMNTTSTRVDFDRLDFLNRLQLNRRLGSNHQRSALVQELLQLVTERYGERVRNSPLCDTILSDEYMETVLDWSKERISQIADLVQPNFSYLWIAPESDSLVNLSANKSVDDIYVLLTSVIDSLDDLRVSQFTMDNMKIILQRMSGQDKTKYQNNMKVLRAALSGLEEGPSVAEMISTLGKENTIHRLEFSRSQLQKHKQSMNSHDM